MNNACDNCPTGPYCKRCLCLKCKLKKDCPGMDKCIYDDNVWKTHTSGSKFYRDDVMIV